MTAPAATDTFSRRAVTWIVGLCGCSIALGVALALFGDGVAGAPSHGPDTRSASALGHAAFRQLLATLDIPVLVSRNRASRRAARGGLLIIAEPGAQVNLRERLGGAQAVLVVLPKWEGRPHPLRQGWVERVDPVPLDQVTAVCRTVAPEATIHRPGGGGTGWDGGPVAPAIDGVQLTQGSALTARVLCREGVLVGSVDLPEAAHVRCWVLTDPDLIATHGLGRGANAELAVWLVEHLRGGGPVVFDETVHGGAIEPGLWREMGSFPLVLVTLQGLLCVALCAWSAVVRFGTPLPPPPPHAAGKRFLIANTATLQREGGHSGYVLVRYWRATQQRVAERLHLPAGLAAADLRARLAQAAARRGAEGDLDRLAGDAGRGADREERGDARARRLVKSAERIHRWQEAMLHGT